MNQEKIAQAIAAYLENADWVWRLPASTSAEKIASDIAAAISPHMEAAPDFPRSELFDHMANEHGLTLINTELGDIIHVARGGVENAIDKVKPTASDYLYRPR